MFLVTNESSLAYFGQNLVAYFTNQGVETPCYRTSKATAFSCEHPIASYCFCKPKIVDLKTIIMHYIKYYFALILALFILVSSSNAQACLENDSLALVNLYNANGGNNWTTTWDLNNPVSTWYGVQVVDCKVIEIRLNNNNLTGTLPNLNLPHLEILYLANNQLLGAIPAFSYLNKLEWLGLSRNQLTGTIPDFSSSPRLMGLDLSENLLAGNLPNISSTSDLEFLNVAGNQLTGTIPSLSSQRTLRFLNLSKNQFSESALDFANLTNLVSVILSENELSENPEGLANLPFLHELFITQNKFNFSAILPLVTLDNFNYAPQDSIAISQPAPLLLQVDAGGNSMDNTYIWYKDGIAQDTIVGDSLYPISTLGAYRCEISNSNLADFTLYTHTLNVCGNITTPSYPLANLSFNLPPYCANESLTFRVNAVAADSISRYIFMADGEVLQDSSSNILTVNDLSTSTTIYALLVHTNGCLSLSSEETIDFLEQSTITTCNPSSDVLQITLEQGSVPWSFDLNAMDSEGNTTQTSYTVSSLDTTLTSSINTQYEIMNIASAQNACSNTNNLVASHIQGCANVCVGYSNPQLETYTANFTNTVDPSTIQWNFFPISAILNGDIAIYNGQAGNMVDIDFSNPAPSIDTLVIQATATTDCGTEILKYQIVLNQACVWPGDVDNDGNALTNNLFNFVNDALALENAKSSYYDPVVNSQGTETGITFNRNAGCLAVNTYDWAPQASRDWAIELSDGSQVPFEYYLDNPNGGGSWFNLKYADANGDGELTTTQQWDSTFYQNLEEVPNPSDIDVVVYHAEKNSQHNGNAPIAKVEQNYAELLQITPSDSVLVNGSELVFTVTLGTPTEPVVDVSSVAFVAEAEFGTFQRPSLSLVNSHLTNYSGNSSNHPFLKDDADGVPDDSLVWYSLLSRTKLDPTPSVSFIGEQVCELTCHATVAGLLDPSAAGNKLSSNPLGIPVKFRISSGGVLHTDGTITPVKSKEVTLYIQPNPSLNAKVILQGGYEESEGLMRDDLRTLNLIPAQEPFSQLVGYDSPQAEAIGLRMTDSSAVLSVTGQEAIVDWVWVEIWDSNATNDLLLARPALLTRAGNVVDMDGSSPVQLWRIPQGEYFVKIQHRNHLGTTTAFPILLDASASLVDFTTIPLAGEVYVSSATGTQALFAGDATGEGSIDASDRSATWNARNTTGYFLPDCNLDGNVTAADRSITWNNRNKTN